MGTGARTRGVAHRRVLVGLIAVSVVVGCSSDGSSEDRTPSPGQVSAGVAAAKAAVCSALDELSGSLATISEEGTEAGDEVMAKVESLSNALATAAGALEAGGASDLAEVARSLASDLDSLTGDGGGDARARAAEAAGKADRLATDLQCAEM